ncbi:dihydrodipicolinate synthase family protein [Alphaproteobacteria bacterium LSUCC0684]
MDTSIRGIVPVMLTPFKDTGDIDWEGLEALIHWYLDHGAEALFSVCQSSEMAALSLAERGDLARFTVKTVAGRVPVLASGHVADSMDDQIIELQTLADTGIDCLVLVTNRLDTANTGRQAFVQSLKAITATLPDDLPLGLYECPAPFRRLLDDDEVKIIADDPRFVFLKDVSCDLSTVKRRLSLAEGSALAINNANAAIASDALKAGADGFCGVFTNFHPDLYRWLQDEGPSNPELAYEMAIFLALAAATEPMGYPKLAKLYHQRLGTFASPHSRVVKDDIQVKYWALDEVITKVIEGTEHYRNKISASKT